LTQADCPVISSGVCRRFYVCNLVCCWLLMLFVVCVSLVWHGTAGITEECLQITSWVHLQPTVCVLCSSSSA